MTEKPVVLVVDDDFSALSLVGIMLDREGFRSVKAADAHEALAALGQGPPALIILDLIMPGIDGVRLATILRQRSDTSQTPILMLSSINDQEHVRRGLSAGANDYMVKPVLHADLIAKVRELINRSA